jgi:hypothetical protein
MTKETNDYWQGEWKVGSRICATDGDWTIGNGVITGFKDDEKLWAIVKLDDEDADTKGYQYEGKRGYVLAYKGYSYRLTKNKSQFGGVF